MPNMSAVQVPTRQRACYVNPDSAFLAARWLRGAARGPVRLVYAEGARELAESLRNEHAPDATVVPEDAAGDGGEIILPLALDHRPLRHQAGALLPDVRPHYPLIARLWRAGYRRFTWCSLAGEQALELPHLLESFRDRHKGQRCFVVGNGPSLNQIDMARLKDEITFGSNRCYMGFPDWGFEFTYWGIYDALQIEEYGPEYEANVPPGPVKFYPYAYWPLLRLPNACPIAMDWPRAAPREFSTDPHRLIVGYSVTFMLLQIAAFMGCDPIYLVGLDHRYHITRPQLMTRAVRLSGKWVARHFDHTPWYRAAEGAVDAWRKARRSGGEARARIWQANDAAGATHFTSKYTSEQKRFLMPRPQDAERDYECALAWARANGRSIVNATPNSALRVFPMVAFDQLFQQG